MSDTPSQPAPNFIVRAITSFGEFVTGMLHSDKPFISFVGGIVYLIGDTLSWIFRTFIKREAPIGRQNIISQMVRVGIKSIPIITLVQTFIGIILALQMAPTLRAYGQIERIADIVGIAVFRELGPLLSGIVLSGFAGASIAAELGTMVEGEEIKALRAIALNPIRFLVMPRFIATVIMLTMLIVIADVVGVFGGYLTATMVLGISGDRYLSATQAALVPRDFLSGLSKGPVFGLLISMIACYEGLNVSGGAEGVGRATTNTVVKCIVALISADVVVTSLLYAFGY
jgi:phospholipid/cholesterol/gamma-HCH transport system permease protein